MQDQSSTGNSKDLSGKDSSDAKKMLKERVGDWVCLNCNNLNFRFREICNRCDMHKLESGKTIVSEHELATLQTAPINTKEQFNLLHEFAYNQAKQSHQSQDGYLPSPVQQNYHPSQLSSLQF
jgi:hypothetical protein